MVSLSTRVKRSTMPSVSSVRPVEVRVSISSLPWAPASPSVRRMFVVSTTSESPFPVAPHVSEILTDARTEVWPSIQRDDAGVVDHFDVNGHVGRGLEDDVCVVIRPGHMVGPADQTMHRPLLKVQPAVGQPVSGDGPVLLTVGSREHLLAAPRGMPIEFG